MGVLRPQCPQKAHLNPEWRKALQFLARRPRGAMEDVLELGHGFSRETLTKLTLAGLAELVTETLRADSGAFTIERLHITEAGRRAIRVDGT